MHENAEKTVCTQMNMEFKYETNKLNHLNS